jgi:hypothetical protein
LRIEISINLDFETLITLINTLVILIYSILLELKKKKNNKNSKNKLENNTFKALLVEINKEMKYYLDFYFILVKSFLATFITLISIIFITNTLINNLISLFLIY